FETPVAILRPFNTYGPRQSARAVIPTIITQIASGASKVRLGSIHPTRDFSYVGDTVEAFMAVAESAEAIGQVMNAGSGFEVSVGDTASLIAELMGVEVEIETDENRIRPAGSEVDRLYADNSKLTDLTGWVPKLGGLEGFQKGLEKTIAWFQDPTNLARFKTDRYNI
ncbi:MAG: GDP-mannose 4,6-dehydratase, partial [Planctomycetales bacterium]